MGSADHPDVVVVGGGPAGCATALWAARSGLRVHLLDRPDRRHERPGEALLPAAEPLLRQLGVDGPVLAAGFPRHQGHWIEWGGERRFEAFGEDESGPWLGFQARRATFDDILRNEARRAGVDVQRGRAPVPMLDRGRVVGVLDSGAEVRAPFVVDAAGSGHWLARALDARVVRASPRLVAWYAYLRGDCPRYDAAPSIAADAEGWTWVARVREELYQWVRLPFTAQRFDRMWRPLELTGLEPAAPARGADVTWRLVPAAAGPGYFMAGDAAMVLDPLSSHGVLKAIMSGILAADLIVRIHGGALAERTGADLYRRWQTTWFERDTRQLRALYASLAHRPAWSSYPLATIAAP